MPEIKEKLREEKLNFKTIVFRQIERTNEAISGGRIPFDDAVNCLISMMFPKADEIFKENIRVINETIKNRRKAFREDKKNVGAFEDLMKQTAFQRYRAIMSLLERKGINDI